MDLKRRTWRPSPRIVAQATLAFAVSTVAIWWAFRQADLDIMISSLQKTSSVAVFFFFIGHLVLHALRIWRWRLFIQPLAPSVSDRALFAAANIGIASTFFIPLRLGELIRPLMITRAGAPFGGALSSIVVERIADGLCAVGMFFVFLSFVPQTAPIPSEIILLSRWAAALFGSGLLGLLAAALARGPVLGLVQNVLGRISVPVAHRVVKLAATFLDGLTSLGSPIRSVLYLGLTVFYWISSGFLIWLLGVSYQPDLPLLGGMFTIAVLVFAVMIPAGPAFAGTFQVGFILGLGAFGMPRGEALVIAVVAHAIQLAVMALILGVGFAAAEPQQRASASAETG